MNILFIISIILLLITGIWFYRIRQMKFDKQKQIIQKQLELQSKTYELESTQQKIKDNQQKLQFLHQEQKELENQLKSKEEYLNKYFTQIKNNCEQAFNSYENNLNNAYNEKEKDFNDKVSQLQAQRNQIQRNLDQLKEVYHAATAAKIREQKNEEQSSFYKIKLSEKHLTDIVKLQKFKTELYDPSIVSKVIWSSYVIKPTGELCNRVLGSSVVCGIYKITDKTTGNIYIGQSKDIASRWKQHIKCGLGIDAPATNKLYNAMQKSGIQNFTFELLQKCSANKLNEKERFWIDMYESNKIGLNTQSGVKK